MSAAAFSLSSNAATRLAFLTKRGAIRMTGAFGGIAAAAPTSRWVTSTRAAQTTATACTAPPITADATSVQPTREGECSSLSSAAALHATTASRGDITQRAYGWIVGAAPISKLAGAAETEVADIAIGIETEIMTEPGTETATRTETMAAELRM